MDVKTLERNYQASKKPAKQAPKRSSWLSLIPSALAAGASLIPGVGTGIAATLGGLGEAGSELLGGRGLNLKNIGEQAALSAIPGGLGKIGKVKQVLKGGNAVEKAAIPAVENATQAGKITQIPVKYTSSLASGRGSAQSAKNLLINPTVNDVQTAASSLGNKGYSVSGKVGNYSSATTGASKTTPVVKLQGNKTAVKLENSGKSATEILPGTGSAAEKAMAIANGKTVAGLTPAGIPTKPGLVSRIKSKVTPTPGTEIPISSTAKAGSKIRSANRGIQVGTLVPGEGEKVGITAQQVKDVNGAIDRANTGLRSRTVRGQVQGVQKAKATQQQLIDAEVSKANRELTGQELGAIKDSTKPVIDKVPLAATKGKAYTDEYGRLLSGAKDTKGLNDFIKNMDKEINYGRNAAAPDPLKERIAQAYRDAADKKLVELAPAAKAAKAEWANLHTGEKILTQNKNIEGQGLDVFKIGSTISGGRGLGGGVFQATKEAVGKGLEGVGSAKAVPAYSRGLVKQLATRAVAAPVTSSLNAPDQAQLDQAAASAPPTDPSQVLNYHDPNAVLNAQPTPEDQTAQIKNGLQQAALKALADGDTKGLANIESVIGVLDKLGVTSSAASKPLNATQQQQASNAQSGLQSINDLSTLIKGNRGLVNKSGIPGQGSIIGGFESNLLGTGEYNTAASNIKDVISRLRSGAALTSQEEKRYTNLIPKAGDNDSTITYKLSALQDLFAKFAAPQSTGGSDLTDLLANAGVQ